MNRAAAIVAIAGLALIVAAGFSLRDRFSSTNHPVLPDVEERRVEPAQPPVPAGLPSPRDNLRIRPVAPEIVAAPPVGLDKLERVDARAPLSEIGAARSPSEGPPEETILFRPVATGSGTFTSLGFDVQIAGIVPTRADEKCVSDDVSWPCGVHARTAFRNWLRGRALTCVVPPVPTGEVVVSKCMLGTQDAAAWLATHGWVKADPKGEYVEAMRHARAERRGIFGPAPPVPDTNPGPLSQDETTWSEDVPAVTTVKPVGAGSRQLISEPLPDVSDLSGG